MFQDSPIGLHHKGRDKYYATEIIPCEFVANLLLASNAKKSQ